MRILLVDNGTSYLHQLQRLISDFDIEVCRYEALKNKNTDVYDLVILSGGHTHHVEGNDHIFASEISIINQRKKPIIGICLGFELIVKAFGGTLVHLPHKEKGLVKLQMLHYSRLFNFLPNLEVYESHRWVSKKIPKGLVGLAKSEDGYEVVCHESKPIIGFQFHPEMMRNRTCGDEIFRNALSVLGLV